MDSRPRKYRGTEERVKAFKAWWRETGSELRGEDLDYVAEEGFLAGIVNEEAHRLAQSKEATSRRIVNLMVKRYGAQAIGQNEIEDLL